MSAAMAISSALKSSLLICGILILAYMGRHEVLTSPANPLLKDVRRAIARGGLTEQGWLVAETPHLLEEALRSGLEVQVVLAAESASGAVRDLVKGARLAMVEDALFQKLGDTASSQNVIALVTPPSWGLEQMLGAHTLVITLDGVQDPGNAGAIVRAAEAFGASGAMFLKGTVSPFNPKTLRASAGSLFRLPFVHGLYAGPARAALEQAEVNIYAAMPHGAAPLAEADLTLPCAIVIGSEGGGVSEPMRRGAIGLSIPTAGVESLNAAVAAGILLYEARRQRDLRT
jgi:TrmH family RNA methyltransferase